MAIALGQVDSILRPIIRGIDKRADYSAQLSEGDAAGAVMVKLSMRRKSTTVRLPITDVEEARENLARRNQVRTRLKRALDGMLFVPPPPPLPKNIQPATTDGFFRPAHGGGRRR